MVDYILLSGSDGRIETIAIRAPDGDRSVMTLRRGCHHDRLPDGRARLGIVLMAGGLWLIANRLSVHSELGDLLPEGSTATQRLLLSQVRTGLAGRLMLFAIQGAPG